jgi:sulfofructose kinase
MTLVLCAGNAVLDYVYGLDEMPSLPEKYRANNLTVVGGGMAANAAVAISRLGGKAMLAARVGHDLTGREIISGLQVDHVDCSLIRIMPGRRSTVAAIMVNAKGERMIVSYADPTMPLETNWLPTRLPEGTAAVLGDTRWDEASAHIFRLARDAKVPSLLDGDRAPSHPDVIDLPTHVAFSVQGLREITGIDDPVEGLLARSKTAANWLAVTVGAQGVYFIENGKVVHEPGFKVDVVDTLGAGDTWHGAFALALAEGMPERQAVRFASATAALKCTRFGGRAGIPARAEVNAFLSAQG